MIDVAVIPYSAGGQNRVGTSTRLFGHLPFGQPVLASRGCEQMEEFEPLVRIFDNVESMAAALEALRETGFDDGRREARWAAARRNTWEQRAKSILALLESLD
jgi:glycosyltransferase involved in cell wall biosynthesis